METFENMYGLEVPRPEEPTRKIYWVESLNRIRESDWRKQTRYWFIFLSKVGWSVKAYGSLKEANIIYDNVEKQNVKIGDLSTLLDWFENRSDIYKPIKILDANRTKVLFQSEAIPEIKPPVTPPPADRKFGVESCTYSPPGAQKKVYGYSPVTGEKEWFDRMELCIDRYTIQERLLKRHEPSISPCFIATAAYGTPFAKEIDILRAFRDNSLEPKLIGKVFINCYYRISPSIAKLIIINEKLRAVTRFLLKPIVRIFKK